MTKTALIGSHPGNDVIALVTGRYLEYIGYTPTIAHSVDEILQKMDIHFDAVVMELNLGKPGSYDYTPAKTIYSQTPIQAGVTNFIGFSGNIKEPILIEGMICIPKPFNLQILTDALEGRI